MPEQTEREKAQKSIAENRKAFHDFHLLESFEAGLVLLGTGFGHAWCLHLALAVLLVPLSALPEREVRA